MGVVLSLNSPFFPPRIGAEPRKEESRITCMRMLRKPPFFPPKSGEKPYLASGVIFWMIKIQATTSAFRLIKNMSINPKSVEFHQCHAKPHSIFLHNIKDNERKKSLPRFENTDSDFQVHVLYYANELFVCVRLSFQKLLQNRSTHRNSTKKMLRKGNDTYSLSLRVQTAINHVSIFTFLCFLQQYQRQRKCFLSECELKKGLRNPLTQAAWLGPSKFWWQFWLVRSEHAHASYPGLFFRPPGFSPYMEREEMRVQELDYHGR